MNYKKSIIYSALSLGLTISGVAQSPQYSLNGLGRSIISNNNLSGASVKDAETTQKANISGYNLFDLQTNLDVDSVFNAVAVFRTRSPFGTSFGSKTDFEFRQFSMGGNVNGLKYQLGDIRVELTPYTVFNADLAGTGFESDLFSERREILEYENFNDGNTWLLQGVSGQYAWNLGEESGLGLYAFTTRTASTNELSTPDRLLSGGRLEYALDKHITFGLNEVSLYDIAIDPAGFDYNNNVVTGDFTYNRETEGALVGFKAEFGGSSYSYTDNEIDSTESYSDMTMDVDFDYTLKNSGLKLGFDFRRVGATFASPTAQSRRYVSSANPMLFSDVKGSVRSQQYFDQFTSEEVYNNSISTSLMAFNQYYNNLNPYGDATPNRMVFGLDAETDTSITAFEAGLAVNYGMEIIGEGGSDLRSFMVAKGGGLIHLGNLLETDRLIDVNVGARYENTTRGGSADVALSSMLIDFGISGEIAKKVDLLAGVKYFQASGNEFIAGRDDFNLVNGFTGFDIDVNEFIYSVGARIRFSEKQAFSLNYNMASFTDNNIDNSQLNIGQLFFNFTGKF
jgi:hypothetical protein